LSLPYSSSAPATSADKQDECLRAGEAIKLLLEKNIKPLDILCRESFENAMTVTMALGGSTNSVLHLIAIARAAGIPLTIDDFEKVSERVPFLADVKPSGRYVMEDIHRVGGTPAVLKYLMKQGYINGDVLTVTGKTLAENLENVPDLSDNHEIIHPVDRPLKSSGHLRILRGDLAPEGSVAKITGKEGLLFTGTARVYDCEEDMLAAVEHNEITKGSVVIIRYEGPKGGPGMPEMRTYTFTCGDLSMQRTHVCLSLMRMQLAPRRRSWERVSARTLPCSRTAASRAARTASSSATSRLRRRLAAPSPS